MDKQIATTPKKTSKVRKTASLQSVAIHQEKILRDQEVKAEKDLLNMKISNLETDNLRLIKETEVLKRSLDEAARQVKEIAVKVIESGSQQKPQITPES